MLAHFWLAGLQGTAGHHALLHFFGLQALTGHGIRLHTVLQLGFRGGLPGRCPAHLDCAALLRGPSPGSSVPRLSCDPGLPCLDPPPPLPACVGFLRLRGPPSTLCCSDPGCGWPCSQSL